MDDAVFDLANKLAEQADLFVAVGCSGVVQPAANVIRRARESGAYMVEINPEVTDASHWFQQQCSEPASRALPLLFKLPVIS